MKVHRYFFWIEDNFIEIYKNGNLEKYEGEERLYIDNFKTFWEKWKKNSKIIASRDAIDFTFLVDKKVNKDDLIENLDIYKKETEVNFSSEDLQKLLDIKDFKTIVFEFNDQKKVITKTKFSINLVVINCTNKCAINNHFCIFQNAKAYFSFFKVFSTL